MKIIPFIYLHLTVLLYPIYTQAQQNPLDSIASALRTEFKSELSKSISEINTRHNESNAKLRSDFEQEKKKLSDNIKALSTDLGVSNENFEQEKKKLSESISSAINEQYRKEKEKLHSDSIKDLEIAFIELVNIEEQIDKAQFISKFNKFSEAIQDVHLLKGYNSFKEFKIDDIKVDDDNEPQKKMLQDALNIASAATSKIPVYGPIASTVLSCIPAIIPSLKGSSDKQKQQREKLNTLFKTVTILSAFEEQGAIIEHEWRLIDSSLSELKKLNKYKVDYLVNEYGIDKKDLSDYEKSTTDASKKSNKDKMSTSIGNYCKGKSCKNTYTESKYECQSQRVAYAILLKRIKTNILSYGTIIDNFIGASNDPEFKEFKDKLYKLKEAFDALKNAVENSKDYKNIDIYISETHKLFDKN